VIGSITEMALEPRFPQSSALPGCATLRYAEVPIFSVVRAQGEISAKRTKWEISPSVGFFETKIHTKIPRDVLGRFI
jgi:hypothetical protein